MDETPYHRASHEILFAEEAPKCDVCGVPLDDEGDDDEGVALAGSGLYIWSRGGETIYEETPLCASCSTAIGVSALARWEIEEEEG
jgi:hypothetical protein